MKSIMRNLKNVQNGDTSQFSIGRKWGGKRIGKMGCVPIFAAILSYAAQTQHIAPPKSEFRVGEKLIYTVRWMGIPVGRGVLINEGIEVLNGRKVYHIHAIAGTNTFISKFYRVEDHAHSYIDVEGLYSHRIVKKQSERRYRSHEVIEFDQNAHKARYESLLNKSTKRFDIPSRVQDMLSSFYYFRTQEVEIGRSNFIDVCVDEKNYNLEIKVLSQETLEMLRFGVHDAFKVEPLAKFQGLKFRKGRLWIWFTSDERRVPLLMKVETPYGLVTANLSKME